MPEAFHISEEDLIQYTMGGFKEGQLGSMTAHISLCSECRAQIARIQEELASFAAIQPLSEPPAGARERFMSRLISDNAPESKFVQMRNKSRFYIMFKSAQHWLETPVPMRIVSGALAAALVFAIYDDLNHFHQVRKLLPQLNRLERDESELTELKNFLSGTHAQQVTLREKPEANKAPQGHAIYSSSSGKLVFTASNMPTPPPGKAYELWLLPPGGGAPISAGMFKPDLMGNGAVVFPPLRPNVLAGGFGVTLEDEAGAAAPTLPILISGQ